jgi:hypothetical protein
VWLLNGIALNAQGAVYGTIMIGVLLAAEDARHEGYPATIESAAVVLVLFWLTHCYAHILGVRLQKREPLNAHLLWRTCIYEMPVIEGALIPVVALLGAWAAGLAVGGGVTAALWAAAATIVVLEVAAGWRSRTQAFLRVRAADHLAQAGIGAVMGLALIALKLLLHH